MHLCAFCLGAVSPILIPLAALKFGAARNPKSAFRSSSPSLQKNQTFPTQTIKLS
jgi:hypothetical protein